MAIKIIRDWNSIIINVEKVNKKVVNGGLISILTDYYGTADISGWRGRNQEYSVIFAPWNI